jgi:hypothetical protein
MFGTNDIERSKRFCEAVLTVVGAGAAIESTNSTGQRRLFYRFGGSMFGVSEPIDGQPASAGNGSTGGFKCESLEQVREFHDVAVANGGLSIEDPPGPRSGSSGVLNLANVCDREGNQLCALHRPST